MLHWIRPNSSGSLATFAPILLTLPLVLIQCQLHLASPQSKVLLKGEMVGATLDQPGDGYLANNLEATTSIYEPSAKHGDITQLESMEDLEHVTYLSLRNFNITDESLISSSWLMGLGNALAHKQHQKAASLTQQLSAGDTKSRLALMLESFLSHLRNGHLRRLTLEELEAIVSQLNRTSLMQYDQQRALPAQEIVAEAHATPNGNHSPPRGENGTTGQAQREAGNSGASDRCKHLIAIYRSDLFERHQRDLLQQQAATQSRIEYENQQPQPASDRDNLSMGIEHLAGKKQEQSASSSPIKLQTAFSFNEDRLLRLCQLAIKCHTAEEMVNLIGGQWRVVKSEFSSSNRSPASHERAKSSGKQWQSNEDEDEHAARRIRRQGQLSQASIGEPLLKDLAPEEIDSSGHQAQRPKSLRDSLSLTIAKLCPLILFQLHDDDGICTVRRDDRPPMITVWGFATLFVTIVSFCSLIGLSITPLLGSAAAESSAANSEASGPSPAPPEDARRAARRQRNRNSTGQSQSFESHTDASNQIAIQAGSKGATGAQHHKACLTLFEGLAVGSLVGSALFSLIPQAFELQERESNQGFLLKALIIFFGIYLFFCSERLMRIILDTRQHHKKRKRINHRSSNSFPLPSTTADFEQHNQHGQQRQLELLHRNSAELSRQAQRFPSSAQGRSSRSNEHSAASRRGANGGQQQQQQQQQVPATTLAGQNRAKPTSHQRPEARRCLGAEQQARNGPAAKVAAISVDSAAKKSRQAKRPSKQQLDEREAAAGFQVKDNLKGSGGGKHSAGVVANRSKRRKTRSQLMAGKRRRRRRLQQLPVRSDDEFEGKPAQHQIAGSSSSSLSSESPGNRGDRSLLSGANVRDSYSLADESLAYMSGSSSSDDEWNPHGGDSSDDGDYLQMRAINQHMSQQFSARQQHYALAPQVSNQCHHHHQQQQQQQSQHSRRRHPKQSHRMEEETPTNQSMTTRTSFHLEASNKSPLYPQPRASAERSAPTKQDISTVAWMIVIGDGLHNFIDGISIGAAFSESILSGVSISVAVICEEFPHELGDFAVLVSSGMTVRQALGYNFLSACTCYFGMAVGIILGDVNDSASYISALAAGVFLYIALVDMMGELSATLEETSRDSIGRTLKLLLLQNVGIFIGISIIFILSFIDF